VPAKSTHRRLLVAPYAIVADGTGVISVPRAYLTSSRIGTNLLYINHNWKCRGLAFTEAARLPLLRLLVPQRPGVGRKKRWHEFMTTPFPRGTWERMRTVRTRGETKTDFVRAAA
jgi:hypothetical protein